MIANPATLLYLSTCLVLWCFPEASVASNLKRCKAITSLAQPDEVVVHTVEDIGDSTEGGAAEIIMAGKSIFSIKVELWGEVGSQVFEYYFNTYDSQEIYDLRIQKVYYSEPLTADDVDVVAKEVKTICQAGRELNFPAQSNFESDYEQAENLLDKVLVRLNFKK